MRCVPFLFCALLLSFYGLGCGDGDDAPTETGVCEIVVRSPEEDSELCVGNVFNVWWQSEDTSGKVNVDLYKDGVHAGRLREDSTDLGAFDITCSLFSAAPGDGFQLIVSDASDPECSGISSDFSIYDPDQCSFSILKPVGLRTYYNGDTGEITWESDGASRFVNIELYNSSNKLVETIASRTPDDGQCAWDIVAYNCQSINYDVRIYDAVAHNSTSVCMQRSNYFHIGFRTGDEYQCGDAILAPSPGDVWVRGDMEVISFTALNYVSDKVNLLLVHDGEVLLMIASSLELKPGLNLHQWIVETGEITELTLSCQIRLEDAGSSCCGVTTWPFTITGLVPGKGVTQ